MATIPDCRAMLIEEQEKLRRPFLTLAERRRVADRILVIVSEMFRRPPVRKAPRKARAMNPKLKRQIVAYEAKHPDMPIRDIGAVHGVDGGRVSEAVAGKRR